MQKVYIKKTHWFAVAVLLVGGLCGLVTDAFAQSDKADSKEQLEQVVEIIRKAYGEATEALKRLPRERFETGPVLDSNDYDPGSIVAWVEHNTRWVPYHGVLRGVDGVLLDRMGNSLDRSLLLARLLGDAGFDTRLARGRLSPETVDLVLSRAAATAVQVPPEELLFPDEVIAAAQRVSSEAEALAALVEPLPEGNSADTEAAADHWWVEARMENEWTEVDSLLNGELAAMRPEAVERITPDSLPEALYHKVTIRVVIERWGDGELTEEIPLEHTFRSAEAVYHDLELVFVPYHFEPAPDGANAAVEAEMIAATTEEWLPVLHKGPEVILEQGFDREGNLEKKPGRVAVVRKAEAATSLMQGIGRSEEPRQTHLTGLWLEYQVDVPEREPRIVRREIFDLIGPDRRRNGAISDLKLDPAGIRERGRLLMGEHRVLITNASLPSIALEKAAWELWANQGPQIAGIMRLIDNPEEEDSEVVSRAYREPLVAIDLLGLATARQVLSPHHSSIYLASPNILSTHFMVEIGENLSVRRVFDVVVNDIGVTANGSIAPSRIRLGQGVLDTILEAAMIEKDTRSWNTADLFASRSQTSGGWQRVDAATPNPALSKTANARIADALDAGQIVVAPSQISPDQEPAWWEIDPETGTTLGIGHNGWGTVAEETVRGIGTTGFMHNARRYSISVSCKVVFAYLKVNGWIFANLSGGLTYTVQAMEFLIRRGCSVVI